MARSKFSYRSFTSFVLVWTFLILIVTGAVLYIAPPGRIANWTNWKVFALTKEQWQDVHNLAAIAFLVGGLFHLLKFNWSVLVNYLNKRTQTGFKYRRELGLSTLLMVLVMVGTIAGTPPFASVKQAKESIRNIWEEPAAEPPTPHMEELTLAELAERLNLQPGDVLQKLEFDPADIENLGVTLKEIAERRGLSPNEIYRQLRPADHPTAEISGVGKAGPGWGSKTLAQAAEELGMTSEDALEILQTKEIGASPQDTIRSIATKHGVRPIEIINALKN
jgi:hypothetical protein